MNALSIYYAAADRINRLQVILYSGLFLLDQGQKVGLENELAAQKIIEVTAWKAVAFPT